MIQLVYNMKTYQDTENCLIGKVLRHPQEQHSMRQMAVEAGLSYVTVHKIVPRLLKKKVIRMEKKGKAHLVSIDFDRAPIETLSSASLYEKSKLLKKHPALTLLLRELEEALAEQFYSLLLFGSYVKGTARPESDFDLLFIIPQQQDLEAYKERINKVVRLYPKMKTDLTIVSAADFMEMLNQKYTVGRSAFQQGLVLFGAEYYYSMVKAYVRTHGY